MGRIEKNENSYILIQIKQIMCKIRNDSKLVYIEIINPIEYQTNAFNDKTILYSKDH